MPSTFVPFRMTSALHLHRAQRRGGVGGEVGIAGAGGEDDDAALFEVADGAPPDERLGNGPHLDGARHARQHALVLERVLQRQRVDHGGEHAHVVRRRAVHALGARGKPAEQVAAADDDGGLDPELLDFGDVLGDLRGDGGIDSERLLAHQGFTGELEEYTAVGGLGHIRRIIDR